MIVTTEPFANKKILDSKIFRRKHGMRKVCPANSETIIEFTVPYNFCKINEIEVINCSGNDVADLKVLDDEAGTYCGEPNGFLNQFGFDVCLSDLYYADQSNYDADLFLGMKIQLIFKNNDTEDKNIGINFVLHEIRAT